MAVQSFRIAILICGISSAGVAADPAPVGMDAFGDPLPPGALARFGTTRYRASAQAALSPDGKFLAFRSADDGIAFLDVTTGTVARTLTVERGRAERGLILAPDGKRAALVSYSGLTVIDVASGAELAPIPVKGTALLRSTGPVVFSADGTRVAIAGERSGTKAGANPLVWDVQANKSIGSFPAVQNESVSVALSADGKTLVTWGRHYERGTAGVPRPNPNDNPSRMIQVWDVDTQVERVKLLAEGYTPLAVAISAKGDRVAAATTAGGVEVLDPATGKAVVRFAGRGDTSFLSFSPEGNWIVALARDGTACVWDVDRRRRIALVESPIGNATGVVFTARDRALAWGMKGSAVAVWEIPSGKVLTPVNGHTSAITSIVFPPRGKSVLTAGSDWAVAEWDPGNGKSLATTPVRIPDRTRDYGLARYGYTSLVPGGDYLLVSGGIGNSAAHVMDWKRNLEVMTVTGSRMEPNDSRVVFSQSGERFFFLPSRYIGRPGTSVKIPVWDVAASRRIAELEVPAGESVVGAFSPDGNRVVIGVTTRDLARSVQSSSLQAWDLTSGKPLGKSDEDNRMILVGIAVASDNRSVAVVSPSRVAVWDMQTGQTSRTFTAVGGSPRSIVTEFSPDGRLLAVTSSTGIGSHLEGAVSVHEWTTGTLRHEFRGHKGQITALAFHPDGRTLVSGSSDTTALVWDLTRPAVKEAEKGKIASAKELWEQMDQFTSADAFRAMAALAGRPDDAIKVIKEQLKPILTQSRDADAMTKLIARLDSANFEEREAAAKEIVAVGPEAVESLKAALIAKPGPEASRQIVTLLTRLDRPGPTRDVIRPLRAIELLERIGSGEAKAILKDLAGGRSGHAVTLEARAALARLGESP